jgi:excisionase family DNA binding protein
MVGASGFEPPTPRSRTDEISQILGRNTLNSPSLCSFCAQGEAPFSELSAASALDNSLRINSLSLTGQPICGIMSISTASEGRRGPLESALHPYLHGTPTQSFFRTPRTRGRCVCGAGCVELRPVFTEKTPSQPDGSYVSGNHSAPGWLTVTEAAEHIGVSPDFIYTACAVGGLPHVRLSGRRSIRIRRSHVDDWMQSFTVQNNIGAR